MKAHAASRLIVVVAAFVTGAVLSCSDRPSQEECYFLDDQHNEFDLQLNGYCRYERGEVTPLLEEHCPAGECLDYFFTCDEVPVDHDCQRCTADELDAKVHEALEAEYEQLCPNGPRDIIEFERGCMFESLPHPPSKTTKSCCYTAIVIGECPLPSR